MPAGVLRMETSLLESHLRRGSAACSLRSVLPSRTLCTSRSICVPEAVRSQALSACAVGYLGEAGGWKVCRRLHEHKHRSKPLSTSRLQCGCTTTGTADTVSPLEAFHQLCEKHLGCRLAEDKLTDASRLHLLKATPDALDQGLQACVKTFGEDITAAWACEAPLLVLQPTDATLKQIEFLAGLLAFPPEAIVLLTAEYPEWMTTPTEDLQRSYAALQEQFKLDAFGMTRVLGTNPSLLTTPLSKVRNNLYVLSERLGMSLSVMNKAAAQFPSLMLLTQQQLDDKLAELAKGFEMNTADVLRLLSAAPQLVVASADDVLGEWDALKRLVEETPSWLKQLTSLPPHVLGACIANREFKTRMLFFYETGQLKVRYINIMSILRQDDVDFAQKYRGYIQWLREKAAEAEDEEEEAPPAQMAATV